MANAKIKASEKGWDTLTGKLAIGNTVVIESGFKTLYMRVYDGFIQISHNEEEWQNIISVEELRGEPGDKGDKGDKGDPGKTPVKGTDYFTEEDVNEIVRVVLNNITEIPESNTFPSAEGVSF